MDQEESTTSHSQIQEKRGGLQSNLDSILRKKGYHTGRLFHSQDKATYTFVAGDEVVSLHFDLNRHDLFIKGHKITSITDHEHLEEYLARFKKALMEERATLGFLHAFDKTLSRLRGV